jgi:hypothetical protein
MRLAGQIKSASVRAGELPILARGASENRAQTLT